MTVQTKVNCTKCKNVNQCTDKRTPRSMWAFGARICVEWAGDQCDYSERHERQRPPSPPPPLKSI